MFRLEFEPDGLQPTVTDWTPHLEIAGAVALYAYEEQGRICTITQQPTNFGAHHYNMASLGDRRDIADWVNSQRDWFQRNPQDLQVESERRTNG